MDILDTARSQVLDEGLGLSREQALECLRLPDDQIDALLDLAHEVRTKSGVEQPGPCGTFTVKTMPG